MERFRIFVFIITILVVGTFGTLVFLYARGWRFDSETNKITPKGLLVIKSAPDSAQVAINGEVKTATDATLSLEPGTYDVSVQKEGFLSWNKRLTIEAEIVTEATAHLFKSAPSLSAITLSESTQPVPSPDFTKIAYIVPLQTSSNSDGHSGLWIMEMTNLPLGFSREPRRVTNGDLTDAAFFWSPDGKQIALYVNNAMYILDAGTYIAQQNRINLISQENEIMLEWAEEYEKRLSAQIDKLPDELKTILERKAQAVLFSPDEDMLAYTASGSAEIPENLIKQLPGSSTQKQERVISEGKTYVYDIKEDRNFLIDENSDSLIIGSITTALFPFYIKTENESSMPSPTIKSGVENINKQMRVLSEEITVNSQWSIVNGQYSRRLAWYPTSRHLILAEADKITIMDYDGTNRQTVYAGSYVAPHAFPTLSNDRLIILTNLGATDKPTNLYSLGIK